MNDLLIWFFVMLFMAAAWQGIKLLDFLADRAFEEPEDKAERLQRASLAKDPEYQYRLAKRARERAEHEYWDICYRGREKSLVAAPGRGNHRP